MEIKEADILKTVKMIKEEEVDQPVSAPQIIQKTIQNSVEFQSGISVKVTINYESISGNLKNRDFIIRRVIKHNGEYFVDGLALDVQSPRLVRVNKISHITDSATHIVYSDPFRFIQNVLGVHIEDEFLPEEMSDFAKAIKETSNEITVLMYLVALDGIRDAKERFCVLQYIRSRVPYLNYDETQMNDYLISLAPDDDSFSMALARVIKKGKLVIEPLLQVVLDIITADGVVHEKEKAFLARLIDFLKQDGYEINLDSSK